MGAAASAFVFFSLLLATNLSSIVMPAVEYLPVHTMLEMFTVAVCFAIFMVLWSSHRYTGNATSLIFGATFATVGVIHVVHALTYNGMPDFLGPTGVKLPTYFWIAARIDFAVMMVALAFLGNRQSIIGVRRDIVFVGICVFLLIVIGSIVANADSLPDLVVVGVGLTQLKVALECLVIALFVVAALIFERAAVRERSVSYSLLTAALAVGVFEEICFTLYGSVYDAFNLLGHLFGLVSFMLIYFALFARTVAIPYSSLETVSRALRESKDQLEARVKERTKALAQTNKKLNLLSGLTRHDIRNELVLLTGYTTLLEKGPSDPDSRSYAARLTESAKKIDALLEFSKEYEMIGTEAPVWMNLSEALGHAKTTVGLGPVSVVADLGDHVVLADKMLERALHNLMDNSIRHGGEVSSITFRAHESARGLELTVEDDGTGVPLQEKERIFERGFGRNTGLGLYFVREVLAITGATIHERGTAGKGAMFEMVFPQGTHRRAQNQAGATPSSPSDT